MSQLRLLSLLGSIWAGTITYAQMDTISPNLISSFGESGMKLGTIEGADFGTVMKKDPTGGGYYVAGLFSSGQAQGVFVTRYFQSGNPDPGFNGGEPVLLTNLTWNTQFFSTSFAWRDTPQGMTLDNSGRPVLCGTSTEPGQPTQMRIVRLTLDGQLDITYGNNGSYEPYSNAERMGLGIVTLPNGKMMCFGAWRANEQSEWNSNSVRLNQDGGLDLFWNTVGARTWDVDENVAQTDYVNAAAGLSNGDVLFVGTCHRSTSDIDLFIKRLSSGGQDVSGFGSDGNGLVLRDMFGHNDWSTDLLVDEVANRVYVTVISDQNSTQNSDLAIACFRLDNGEWDTQFGNGGKAQIDITSTGSPYNDDFLGGLIKGMDGSLYGCGSLVIDNEFQNGYIFRFTQNGDLYTSWLDSGIDTLCYAGEALGILMDGDDLVVCGFRLDIENYTGGDAWDSMDHFVAKYGQDVINGVDVQALAPTAISCLPNPTTGPLSLTRNNAAHTGMLQVYDAVGQLVVERSLRVGERSITLDLSGQPSGIYVVMLRSNEGGREVVRIVKE